MNYAMTFGALFAALATVACSGADDDLVPGGAIPPIHSAESDGDADDAGSASTSPAPSDTGEKDEGPPSSTDAGDGGAAATIDGGADAGGTSTPPVPGSIDDLDAFAKETIGRVMQWVAVDMPYCGGPKNGQDLMYCSDDICRRSAAQSNPAWDPYRTDCSGTVSFAWKLAPPGLTTWGFAPFDRSITTEIKVDDLRPGDALNQENHVVLFGGWADEARTKARILEEYGCKKAVDRIMPLTKTGDTTVQYGGRRFYAIRFDERPGFTPPPL